MENEARFPCCGPLRRRAAAAPVGRRGAQRRGERGTRLKSRKIKSGPHTNFRFQLSMVKIRLRIFAKSASESTVFWPVCSHTCGSDGKRKRSFRVLNIRKNLRSPHGRRGQGASRPARPGSHTRLSRSRPLSDAARGPPNASAIPRYVAHLAREDKDTRNETKGNHDSRVDCRQRRSRFAAAPHGRPCLLAATRQDEEEDGVVTRIDDSSRTLARITRAREARTSAHVARPPSSSRPSRILRGVSCKQHRKCTARAETSL